MTLSHITRHLMAAHRPFSHPFINIKSLQEHLNINIGGSDVVATKCYKYKISPLLEPIKICTTSQNTEEIHIYTDGSKTETGTVSAFCVFNEDQNYYSWQVKIDPSNSVFHADVFAIGEAIHWAFQKKQRIS